MKNTNLKCPKCKIDSIYQVDETMPVSKHTCSNCSHSWHYYDELFITTVNSSRNPTYATLINDLLLVMFKERANFKISSSDLYILSQMYKQIGNTDEYNYDGPDTIIVMDEDDEDGAGPYMYMQLNRSWVWLAFISNPPVHYPFGPSEMEFPFSQLNSDHVDDRSFLFITEFYKFLTEDPENKFLSTTDNRDYV